ncbi:MAG TPA: hypothetical protein VFB38_02675 [Chthonomonadaceae bacterium]|nr:hypothetical protein [Chthonomonadaceae bacterium]
MQEAKVRNRLSVALLLSILMVAVAGVLNWRIGEEADAIHHQIEHAQLNLELLKFYIAHHKAQEARR